MKLTNEQLHQVLDKVEKDLMQAYQEQQQVPKTRWRRLLNWFRMAWALLPWPRAQVQVEVISEAEGLYRQWCRAHFLSFRELEGTIYPDEHEIRAEIQQAMATRDRCLERTRILLNSFEDGRLDILSCFLEFLTDTYSPGHHLVIEHERPQGSQGRDVELDGTRLQQKRAEYASRYDVTPEQHRLQVKHLVGIALKNNEVTLSRVSPLNNRAIVQTVLHKYHNVKLAEAGTCDPLGGK